VSRKSGHDHFSRVFKQQFFARLVAGTADRLGHSLVQAGFVLRLAVTG
jgi:hypothetical protein